MGRISWDHAWCVILIFNEFWLAEELQAGAGLLVPLLFESSPVTQQSKSLAKSFSKGWRREWWKLGACCNQSSFINLNSPFPVLRVRQIAYTVCLPDSVPRARACFKIPLRTAHSKIKHLPGGRSPAQPRRINSAVGTGALVAWPVCKGCVWALEGANLRQAQLVCLLNSPSKVIRGDCGFALSKTPLTSRESKNKQHYFIRLPQQMKAECSIWTLFGVN